MDGLLEGNHHHGGEQREETYKPFGKNFFPNFRPRWAVRDHSTIIATGRCVDSSVRSFRSEFREWSLNVIRCGRYLEILLTMTACADPGKTIYGKLGQWKRRNDGEKSQAPWNAVVSRKQAWNVLIVHIMMLLSQSLDHEVLSRWAKDVLQRTLLYDGLSHHQDKPGAPSPASFRQEAMIETEYTTIKTFRRLAVLRSNWAGRHWPSDFRRKFVIYSITEGMFPCDHLLVPVGWHWPVSYGHVWKCDEYYHRRWFFLRYSGTRERRYALSASKYILDWHLIMKATMDCMKQMMEGMISFGRSTFCPHSFSINT